MDLISQQKNTTQKEVEMPKDPRQLTVYIGTPENTLYNGPAKSVSSFNDIGPFDVLGKHQNFITTVKNKVTIKTTDNQKRDFEIGVGVLRTHLNIVDVFVGIEFFEKKKEE